MTGRRGLTVRIICEMLDDPPDLGAALHRTQRATVKTADRHGAVEACAQQRSQWVTASEETIICAQRCSPGSAHGS